MINRPKISNKTLKKSIDETTEELQKKLTRKGWGSFVNTHEALGIISEEFDEFKLTVHANNNKDAEKELKDIALACIWAIASIKTLK